MKRKPDVSTDAEEKSRIAKHIEALGIPHEQLTEPVLLAVSALLENLDDTTRELKQAKEGLEELQQLVDVDVLAPIPNRRAFMRRLAWAISMFERYDHVCSLLYFDVNNFKKVNDAYGHAAGDEIIRQLAKVLTSSLRESDFTARLGGDEFAIILYHASLDAARERGQKITARFARMPIVTGKHTFFMTAACGVCQIQNGDTPDAALTRADADMYLDKKRQKARVTGATA